MLYGFKNGLTTVVAAAPTVPEFEAFYQQFDGEDGQYVEHRATGLMDIGDALFKGFRHPVYIFAHRDAGQQDAFLAEQGIEVKGRNYCISKHGDMMDAAENKNDPYDPNDTRTISQIHGLDNDDRWDRRSDEEKAAYEELQAKIKDHMKQAKARGDMSGDSFSPVQHKKGAVKVTDIRSVEHADGTVTIDNAIAHKFGGQIDEEEKARRAAEKKERQEALGKLPRPWNDGTTVSLPADERAKLHESYEGKEFLFCAIEVTQPRRKVVITITPRLHFEAHSEPWDAAPLNINHLLPRDFKEIGIGVYETTSRDAHLAVSDLASRGFVESLLLNIWLNNQ